MVDSNRRSPRKKSNAKGLSAIFSSAGLHAATSQLRLFPIREVEVDGIAMGVLSDGSPYLTLRGLARMCGVNHMAILRLASNWEEEQQKRRGARIKELLAAQGHPGDALNVQTTNPGIETHVYTDSVCMAVLEYYAFDADQGSNATAVKHFRLLARHSFRKFIFDKCGYDPDRHIPDSWRNFHERILLNDQIPANYFSVFREMADLAVHMIKAGCEFDDHTVPDISVGVLWGKAWAARDYDCLYARLKHPHDYPEWYPQSVANPVPAWIYPIAALPTFHTWLYIDYIPKNFPKYVAEKVKNGIFLPSRADALIAAATMRQPLVGKQNRIESKK